MAKGPIEGHADVVLHGRPGTAMQAFAAQLNEVDIAAVVTFERNAWGNNMGDKLTPQQVATLKTKNKQYDHYQGIIVMSAVIESDHHDHHHGPAKGILRWVFTTNHKDIGTMYLWFSFIMFLVGGTMALIIRAELFEPGMQIVKPEFLIR